MEKRWSDAFRDTDLEVLLELTRDQIISHHNQTPANLAPDGVAVRVLPADDVSFA